MLYNADNESQRCCGETRAYRKFAHRRVQEKQYINYAIPEKVVEETDTTRIIMNLNGLFAEVPKDGHDTIHYTKPSVVTPDDWRKVKAERFNADDPDRKIDVEAMIKTHPPDRDWPVGVDCGSMIGNVRNILTFEGLAYACYDYPAMVEDIVETCCVLVENFLDLKEQMFGMN